jgi:hypothetical protein
MKPGHKSLRASILTAIGLSIGWTFCRTQSARGVGEPRSRPEGATGRLGVSRRRHYAPGAHGKRWVEEKTGVDNLEEGGVGAGEGERTAWR